MMLDDFRAGQVLGAAALNAIRDELIRLAKVSAAAPLFVSDDAAGFHFELDEPEVISIEITGAGVAGAYPWTEQYPVEGGGWTDGPRSGTTLVDPAWEANLNATISSETIILRAFRDPITGDLRFERGDC
jgi:hypothetical protein